MPRAVVEPAPLIVAEPPTQYLRRPPLVVDCSTVCAVLFQEAEREQAAARMRGQEVHAPALLDYEVASVALRKLRAGLGELAREGLDQYAALPITLYPGDLAAITALAQRYRLSAYDASYLWLAAELKAPLATFDRVLGDAASAT